MKKDLTIKMSNNNLNKEKNFQSNLNQLYDSDELDFIKILSNNQSTSSNIKMEIILIL